MGSYARTLFRSTVAPRGRKALCRVTAPNSMGATQRERALQIIVRRAPWDFVQPENEDAFDVPTRRERGVDRRSVAANAEYRDGLLADIRAEDAEQVAP